MKVYVVMYHSVEAGYIIDIYRNKDDAKARAKKEQEPYKHTSLEGIEVEEYEVLEKFEP